MAGSPGGAGSSPSQAFSMNGQLVSWSAGQLACIPVCSFPRYKSWSTNPAQLQMRAQATGCKAHCAQILKAYRTGCTPFWGRWGGLEAGQAVEVLWHVLLDLQDVVDVIHLIIHGRLVRCVLPVPVHNELVLLSTTLCQLLPSLQPRAVQPDLVCSAMRQICGDCKAGPCT